MIVFSVDLTHLVLFACQASFTGNSSNHYYCLFCHTYYANQHNSLSLYCTTVLQPLLCFRSLLSLNKTYIYFLQALVNELFPHRTGSKPGYVHVDSPISILHIYTQWVGAVCVFWQECPLVVFSLQELTRMQLCVFGTVNMQGFVCNFCVHYI